MSHTFDNPEQFLSHLESKLNMLHEQTDHTKINLLHGSAHAIRYLIESQSVLSTKFYELVHVLNDADHTWAHKLTAIYEIMEAGTVTPEQMQHILEAEICGKPHDNQTQP
jgi:hypothetical protein